MRILVLWSLLAVQFAAVCALAEDLEAPGGVWWKKKNRITVKEEIVMTAPLLLMADEIVIQKPIVTNGFSLDIEARKVTFEGDGRIETFRESAKPIESEGPPHATGAATGGGDGGQGAEGAAGKPGFDGIAGMGAKGALPAEIAVFAADLHGTPVIDAKGQSGGKGGKGGLGQTGGQGGKGRRGNARLIGGNRAAGQGGRGGKFGKGGKGGRGGAGGAPVPVAMLIARDWRADEVKTRVTSVVGKGGPGGEAGNPGAPGQGGPGGDGDKVKFAFFTSRVGNGPAGGAGEACPYPIPVTDPAHVAAVTLGPGDPGPDGTVPSAQTWLERIGRDSHLVVSGFGDFESRRAEVVANWFEFHWWRMFELVTRTSMQLLLPAEKQDAEADPLGDLLGGDLDVANLQLVADRWTKAFLNPLKRRATEVEKIDPKLHQRLKRVIDVAEPYTAVLVTAKKRGAIRADESKELDRQVKRVSEIRGTNLTAAIRGCGDYVENVLGTEIYRRLLLKRQAHFEVPSCRTTEAFLGDNGVKHPIQLASDFTIPPGLNNFKGLSVEQDVAPDITTETARLDFPRRWFASLFGGLLDFFVAPVHAANSDFVVVPVDWTKLRQEQIREFHAKKDASTAVGSLGVHRGFLYPKKRPSLENLDAFLSSLVRTL